MIVFLLRLCVLCVCFGFMFLCVPFACFFFVLCLLGAGACLSYVLLCVCFICAFCELVSDMVICLNTKDVRLSFVLFVCVLCALVCYLELFLVV